MNDIANTIGEYGILTTMAGAFLFIIIQDRVNNRKRDDKYNESLTLLSKSNDNIASSLALLTRSIDENKELLCKHDERSIKLSENMNINSMKIDECKEIIKNCKRVGKE